MTRVTAFGLYFPTDDRRKREEMGTMNGIVATVLESPLRFLLSQSTALIRYHGRRTGRVHRTPVQYAGDASGLVILAGRPWQKKWWRNFEVTRELDVLLDGEWVPMHGRAHVGADDPAAVEPLLTRYLDRFPKATRSFEGVNLSEWVRAVVVVECRPAPVPMTASPASASKRA